ncbi:MAG: PQQ-binding-like beta-propeller repeat protein [Adhaeribacter sp.]|nr:PQQ-binding-like beta-propeller repeat protein [Adhaeribacter sp.]
MKNDYSQLGHTNAISSYASSLNRTLCQVTFILLLWVFSSPIVLAQKGKMWLSGGQNLQNTRHAQTEKKISPETAGRLIQKWAFPTAGDISANPAVDDISVYFPDWGGYLYSVNVETGALLWKKQIKEYTGQTANLARATPAISGNKLIIGTQLGEPTIGAHVLGINKVSGALLWKTKVDNHPASVITQGAVVFGNRVYVGVSSVEEFFASNPTYPCCSFRGSLVCLDLNTGKVLWKTYMTPQIAAPSGDKGFSGVAIWGSTPVIDTKRNSVYVATGNNYTVPNAVLSCVATGGTPEEVRNCIMAVNGSAENYLNAVVSIDLKTGAVKWAKSVVPFDAWTVACFFDGPNCPENAGPDYDFGQGPALFSVGSGANKRDLLGAGQKSGIYWALNPDNGNEVWHTQVGPGGELGGLQWGSAVDGNRIYTAVSNSKFIPHLMTTGPGAGNTVKGGFWAALNAATGARIWETAASNSPATNPQTGTVAINTGMVTVANGVMFAGAMDAQGTMYAFNAATGEKLWSFESGGSVNSGAAVVNGNVYWGSGYTNLGLGTPGNKLYAFKIGTTQQVGVSVPTEYLLGQNYPNPINGTTEIRFHIPIAGKVILGVYDGNGIEIQRLVDEVLPVGEYKTTWQANSNPNGQYMYRISSGLFNQSKHMILLR